MINPYELDGNSSLLVAAYLQVPGSRLQSPRPGLWHRAIAGAASPAAGGLPRHRSLREDVGGVQKKFPEHETRKKANFGMLGDVGDSFFGSFLWNPHKN